MEHFFFNNQGQQIGKFWFDDETGTLKFEGNLHETSTTLLEQYLKPQIDKYIKENKKRGPYNKKKEQ